MGFGATKAAHDVLILAQPGETFDIEVRKNDNGYNDWVSARKSDGAGSPSPSARPAGSGASLGTGYQSSTAPRSNFETPEERAKKQVYIVRQSSISSAINILVAGSKTRPDIKEVIDVASQLENYVFGGDAGAQAESYAAEQKAPSDLDDEIPF